jgi:hypothetical protein
VNIPTVSHGQIGNILTNPFWMGLVGDGCCGAQMIPKSYPGKDLVIGLLPMEAKSAYHCLILNYSSRIAATGGRKKHYTNCPNGAKVMLPRHIRLIKKQLMVNKCTQHGKECLMGFVCTYHPPRMTRSSSTERRA